jgi:hypothetical protein
MTLLLDSSVSPAAISKLTANRQDRTPCVRYNLVRRRDGQMGCRTREAARLANSENYELCSRARRDFQDFLSRISLLYEIFRNAPEFCLSGHELVQQLVERLSQIWRLDNSAEFWLCCHVQKG